MHKTKTQKFLDGLESLVNKKPVSYLQIGAVNACDDSKFVQLGGFNFADKLKGLQSAIFVNFAHSVKGIQNSLVNVSVDNLDGLQVGLIAYANSGNYIQLGLLTIRAGNDSWYKRISPFVGYHLDDDIN